MSDFESMLGTVELGLVSEKSTNLSGQLRWLDLLNDPDASDENLESEFPISGFKLELIETAPNLEVVDFKLRQWEADAALVTCQARWALDANDSDIEDWARAFSELWNEASFEMTHADYPGLVFWACFNEPPEYPLSWNEIA